MSKNFAYAFPAAGQSDKMLEIGFVDTTGKEDLKGVLFFRDMDTKKVILTTECYMMEIKKLRDYLFGEDGE